MQRPVAMRLPGRLAVLAVLMMLAACGGGGGSPSDAVQPANEENAAELRIMATSFEFDQPEYVIRKGEPVTFVLANDKGYHEVKIEGLNIRLKPGESRQYIIHEAGEYRIVCSIACGAGHSNMVSRLVVQE